MYSYTLENIPGFRLRGISITNSLREDNTHELWKNFILNLKRSSITTESRKFNIRQYPDSYFNNIDLDRKFISIAAIESIHLGRDILDLGYFDIPPGTYAVFTYNANLVAADEFFKSIFTKILSKAKLEIDTRPHFEILHEFENSAIETVFIPVKSKH